MARDVNIQFTTDEHTLLHGPPGMARWCDDFTRLEFMCPCGNDHLAGVRFQPAFQQGWKWDGDKEKPTVTPSILINPCGWHGYLTKGQFKES